MNSFMVRQDTCKARLHLTIKITFNYKYLITPSLMKFIGGANIIFCECGNTGLVEVNAIFAIQMGLHSLVFVDVCSKECKLLFFS